jgi:23S rRNA (adenine2503-C2)-methyltransferase
VPYLHAPEDLGDLVGDEASYRVDQLRDWLYRTPVLSIESTMIDGVNDTDDQAVKLAAIAGRLRAHGNLIALNPTPHTLDTASSQTRIWAFAALLERRGVNVTVRETRGPRHRRRLRSIASHGR